jgi:hypothetical protein
MLCYNYTIQVVNTKYFFEGTSKKATSIYGPKSQIQNTYNNLNRSDPRMMETKKRKKTGPKPLYGEAKKMVSFRLSPEALAIIKALADKDSLSQAEVLERWARQFKTNVAVEMEAQTNETEINAAYGSDFAISNRELVGSQR